MDLKNLFKRGSKSKTAADDAAPEEFSFYTPDNAGQDAGGGFDFQAGESEAESRDEFGFQSGGLGGPSDGFGYAEETSKYVEPTSFFGFFKKGLRIALFKGDAVDEVAEDKAAFGPALFIYMFPGVILGVLMVAAVHFITGFAANPDAPIELVALAGLLQKASYGIIIVLLLTSFVGSLVLVGLVHLSARLLKGDGGFLDFYQTMGVGNLVNWLCFIPLVGFWQLAINVFVTARVHNISTGKAVAANVLALFFLMVLGIVIPAVLIGAAGM